MAPASARSLMAVRANCSATKERTRARDLACGRRRNRQCAPTLHRPDEAAALTPRFVLAPRRESPVTQLDRAEDELELKRVLGRVIIEGRLGADLIATASKVVAASPLEA